MSSRPTFELYFTAHPEPRFQTSYFGDLKATIGEVKWREGMKALSVFLLESAAWELLTHEEKLMRGSPPKVEGGKKTFAASLDNALSSDWARKIFGSDDDDRLKLLEHLDRSNANFSSNDDPLSVAFIAQPGGLLPIGIRVNAGGEWLTTPRRLTEFAEAIRRTVPEWNTMRPISTVGGIEIAGPSENERARLDKFRQFIQRGDFRSAFREFFEEGGSKNCLSYRLDFIYNLCNEHLEYISMFFPDDNALLESRKRPRGLEPREFAKLLIAWARAQKNTGWLDRATIAFEQALKDGSPDGESRVHTLTGLANSLRLQGRLREAHERANEAFQCGTTGAARGYALYWRGIVAGVCGALARSEKLLLDAQSVFALIRDTEGLGRTFAHRAQLELWLGHASRARILADRSLELAGEHHQRRERIFAHRLIGISELMLGNRDDSRTHLELARAEATEVGYLEEDLACRIGLAELDSLDKRARCINELNEIQQVALTRGYRLLRTDALNALTRSFFRCHQRDDAAKIARGAHDSARCDGPPFAYGPGLRQAERHLEELAVEVDPFAEATGTGDAEGDLRQEFNGYMRIIDGPYRYVQSKFMKLLTDDWADLCRIALGEQVMLSPQHVEIHVGEWCNLNCLYCRGDLREKPKGKGASLRPETARAVINGVARLNPSPFVRFSGLIGEPLAYEHIDELFALATERQLKWGLTTNGVFLDERKRQSVLGAQYVHVSLDAGSAETYFALKGGLRGNFDLVLQNLQRLGQARQGEKKPAIVVSILLQKENFRELQSISQHLERIGIDNLEIKMQHFDARRRMSEEQVREAYRIIDRVRQLDDGHFRVVVVQSEEQALDKVRETANRISFPRCYANQLGLNATVDPHGSLQTCCQYYQGTLGSQGRIGSRDFGEVWNSEKRREGLNQDPRGHCVNCSPSDEFVNKFVHCLCRAAKHPGFLEWAQSEINMFLAGDSALRRGTSSG